MQIGLSLPIGLVLPGEPAKADLWRQIFPEPDELLLALKAMGINSIEVKGADKVSPAELRRGLTTIADSGLSVTFHGSLPPIDAGLPPFLPEAHSILAEKGLTGTRPVTVHAYSNSLIDDTVSGLKAFAGNCREQQLMFTPALEICRVKKQYAVGTSYDSVYAAVKQAGFENVGICWDIGHTQSNYSTFDHPRLPDEKWLKQVTHTHIHSITKERTHGFVLADDRYVADCTAAMRSTGYTGVYNFELYPARWGLQPEQARTMIEASVANLIEMLQG